MTIFGEAADRKGGLVQHGIDALISLVNNEVPKKSVI